jgi:hypothetical protein
MKTYFQFVIWLDEITFDIQRDWFQTYFIGLKRKIARVSLDPMFTSTLKELGYIIQHDSIIMRAYNH